MTRASWINLFLVMFGLGLVGLIYYAVTSKNKNRSLCESKGGYYFSAQYGRVCLKKESVIDLDAAQALETCKLKHVNEDKALRGLICLQEMVGDK